MDPVPDDVKQLIAGTVDSIDELEILRVLSESPDAAWDVDSLLRAADAEPATVAAAADVLAALCTRGLLSAEEADGRTRYRYGPVTREKAAAMTRLLALYRERPVSTIKAVYLARLLLPTSGPPRSRHG